MIYSEATYFDGYHFAHIAAWVERKRLARIKETVLRAMDRRNGR